MGSDPVARLHCAGQMREAIEKNAVTLAWRWRLGRQPAAIQLDRRGAVLLPQHIHVQGRPPVDSRLKPVASTAVLALATGSVWITAPTASAVIIFFIFIPLLRETTDLEVFHLQLIAGRHMHSSLFSHERFFISTLGHRRRQALLD